MSRVTEFDGLRGAAAFVVVVHHSLLLLPELSTVAFEHKSPSNDFVAWIALSPAHIFWAGSESVFTFFLLSGIVVPRLWEKLKNSAPIFLASRLIRLYLPIWAALALAVIMSLIFPRETGKYGAYFDWLSSPLNFEKIIADLILLPKTGLILGVLWSMTWEIIFIFTVPLMVHLSKSLKAAPLFFTCCLASGLGFYVGNEALMYLPIFQIGVVLSTNWDRFAAKQAISKYLESFLWIFIVVSITSSWWIPAPTLTQSQNRAITMPIVLIGIVILIWLSLQNSMLRNILNSNPLQFLGSISFSLYLTHEPILLALVTIRGGAGWPLALGLPLSIMVGWIFYKFIESRAHQASRQIIQSNKLYL